jgi:hypothetical protein
MESQIQTAMENAARRRSSRWRRGLLTACLVFFALSTFSQSQSPTDAQVRKNSYENTYFKFSYSWPAFLQPFDVNALQLPKKASSNNEFLLFSVRENDEPYGIVVVAERMNVPTQNAGGLKSSSDLMERIARFRPEQHVVMKPRKHFTNPDGIVIDELDYVEDGAPSSAVVIQFRDFLIAFKCNAKSTGDIDVMNRSIADIRRLK